MEGLALVLVAAVVAAVGVGLGILVAPAIGRLAERAVAERAVEDPDDGGDGDDGR